MNKNINNPTPRRRYLAAFALLLTAVAVATPWLTAVAYACQTSSGGC